MPQVRFDRSVWSAARQGPGAAAMAAPSFAQGYMPLQALSPRQDPSLQALRGTAMGTTWTLRLVNADHPLHDDEETLKQQLVWVSEDVQLQHVCARALLSWIRECGAQQEVTLVSGWRNF